MEHESVKIMWERYLKSIGKNIDNTNKTYSSWYFCDNEQDANELAELVLQGTKRATASLYELFEFENQEVPREGELSIITDWEGIARCIIRTTNIEVVPFKDVTAEFAATEGEGDGSLEYWKRAHWGFFARALKEAGRVPSEDMLVLCEKFEVVYR